MTAATNRANAVRFDDAEVARVYDRRTPYPTALFTALFDAVPVHDAALDIGCGPGTVTGPLARQFGRVDAVDPSPAMLGAARASLGEANIRWVEGKAETAPLQGPYDLATAGASLHWCDHAVLFPRLADALAPHGLVAAIGGVPRHDAPWSPAYDAFMTRWLASIGDVYDPVAFQASLETYRAWLDDETRQLFAQPVVQRLEDFIEGLHATATWTRARMGAERAAAFDTDLAATLGPFAADGVLRWTACSSLTTGRPRRTPRAAS